MSIAWDQSLATGVEEIDNQHKELFARFDRLSSACGEGKGKDEVLKLLLFLRDYIRTHFAAEEKLQLASHFPGYAEHRQLHAKFNAEVDRLEASFREEGATLSLVFMTNKTLASWLMQHISKSDMELAAHLRETK